eukprot:5604836-Prymnesium_polylepis.1
MDAPSSRGSPAPGVRRCLTLIVTNCQIWPTLSSGWTRPHGHSGPIHCSVLGRSVVATRAVG